MPMKLVQVFARVPGLGPKWINAELPINGKELITDLSAGGVTTFNTRAGAVTPAADDYTLSQINVSGFVTVADAGTVIVNTAIKNPNTTATVTLPTAAIGNRILFAKVFDQTWRLDPNLSEIIGTGGAGKYLQIEDLYTGGELICVTTGVWTIFSSGGGYSYEV